MTKIDAKEIALDTFLDIYEALRPSATRIAHMESIKLSYAGTMLDNRNMAMEMAGQYLKAGKRLLKFLASSDSQISIQIFCGKFPIISS